MSKPASPFAVIHGNRDVVATLEHALDMARRGQLVGVVLCAVAEVDGEAPSVGFHWAHRDTLSHPWPRMLAAVTDAQQSIAREGLA